MPSNTLIYLIDDDEVNCFLVKNILIDACPACEVVCFGTAQEALQALKKVKNDPANFPAFILLDLYLPVKDGWYFLDQYEAFQNHSFNKCDVIILTCLQHPKDLEKAKKYRCVADFLVKPLNEKTIAQKLDTILL